MDTNQLIARLAEQLGERRQLMLAFSGGLDSSVLLHLLVQLRRQRPELQLRALHVHHGLSAFADRWVAHCRQQCEAWQVPLTVRRVQLDPRDGGIEAAARDARYQALRAALQPDECLLTAQHLDDQCETFLLALKRGSGPADCRRWPPAARWGSIRCCVRCSASAVSSWSTMPGGIP
ncbi:tRNA(Ile)-lysidine synthase [Serratia rubidaea]|uniref:tRNA(Ile)-lysidine synthetase n=1 Tax=Serratia rubidaea TaxID=61652 RepID=A0A4U9HRY0_SERRU|nr:tRNA(Ile)-lysidine synthase [Serratia rubidaea]